MVYPASRTIGYVDRYTKPVVTGFAVEFTTYSWDLNTQRPGAGWVSLERETGGLRKGEFLEFVSESVRTVKVRASDGKIHAIPRARLKFWARPTSRPHR